MTATATSSRSSAEAVPGSAERKHITVLFADVAGSMDLQEQLDAEVWAQIMGRFVSILAEGVRKYGGTVDKFTGDGIMALFGAPVAQEDHARRACHAAWDLTKTIGQYSDELRREQGVGLHVRLGLNSGEVVVGRVGEDVTLDPTALGHTVGLAQRMEAAAEPGKAYLTEHTARLVEGWFWLEDLGTMSVKGSRDLLRVHVLGPPSSEPVRSRTGTSTLVGRAREMAILQDALAMAMERQGQVVGVVGEAGVGKSRLCDEFAAVAAGYGIVVRRTTGVSHGRDVPLLPILKFQREYFEIADGDDPAEARRKVTERLLALDPGLEDALPLLFDFLEVPDPDRPVPRMAPEVRMRRIFDAVRRITARRSERETLVLIFEDLHWFDLQSQAFLERLIESYPGSRTLVVTNFRPEFSAGWMRHSYYRQLSLAPLREQAVSELLSDLLGIDLSLAPLVSFILERTGGNPFFVEEVVRALIEDGTLAGGPGSYRLTRPLHEIRVPPSVQAVLAARIDRLSPQQKAVLETASVIGRTFDPVVLAEVSGVVTDALETALAELCAAELVQQAGDEPGVEYRFWHPLTQEVAYGSLLRGRRCRLHSDVAEALIRHAGSRLDEFAPLVATHWEQAGRTTEAARWNLRAGAWALRSDLREAQRRWWKVVELLRTVEETEDTLTLAVQARIRLLQFGARVGMGEEEAEQLFREARTLAAQLGDPALETTAVAMSGSAKLFSGDFRGGHDRFVESARLADETNNEGVGAVAGIGVAAAEVLAGSLSAGIEWTERTLTRCAGDPEFGTDVAGYSALARTLQIRGWLFMRAGRLVEARSDLEQSLAMARPRSDAETIAWALANLAELAWVAGDGDGDGARMAAQESVRIGEESGNVPSLVLGLEGLALVHLVERQPGPAAETCQRALELARNHRNGRFIKATILAHQARAYLGAGDQDGALSAGDEAVTVARQQGGRVNECLALLARAQVLRATGRTVDADRDLSAALALVEETGAVSYEPLIREELGRLRDDDKELAEALRLYRQIGAVGHATRLEAEISARPVQ